MDVASAALGGGTVLRVLTEDGRAVETDLVSDSDEQAQERMIHCLADTAPTFDPGSAARDAGGDAGQLRSSLAKHRLAHRFSAPTWAATRVLTSNTSSPRRSATTVPCSAFCRSTGSDLGEPYQVGDDDLIQVLADRLGSAIAEHRVRELLERHRTEAMAIADRLQELTAEQRELLDQLASVEERERTLLAEAIHDGPLQLVVGVKMRIDTISRRGQAFNSEDTKRLAGTLETAMHQLRTLIVALTPPDLSEGLGMALRNLAEGIFIGTPTQVTVRRTRSRPPHTPDQGQRLPDPPRGDGECPQTRPRAACRARPA